MTESLFGHLVTRFSTGPENLATEALNYILNQSQVARKAFSEFFSHFDIPLPCDLSFQVQYNEKEDQSIPDLVGFDQNGKKVLIGESKFWAGLTENQPVTYLRRLIKEDGVVLIVFAPSKRLTSLWAELLIRCKQGKMPLELVQVDNAQDMKQFLKDLCTPQELNALAERWRVCRLLSSQDLSYRQIHALTGASLTTIGRVARFLREEQNGGYVKLLQQIQGSNK
jgi:TrpR-related protein YerC/YecD